MGIGFWHWLFGLKGYSCLFHKIVHSCVHVYAFNYSSDITSLPSLTLPEADAWWESLLKQPLSSFILHFGPVQLVRDTRKAPLIKSSREFCCGLFSNSGTECSLAWLVAAEGGVLGKWVPAECYSKVFV